MRGVTKFTLKDVRCFAGEQSIDIRPITLLVGENSTGKSTVLGCYNAFLRCFDGRIVDFNEAPYQMGGFNNIVRRPKQAEGGFTLEANMVAEGEKMQCSVLFEECDSELVVSKAEYSLFGGSIALVGVPWSPSKKEMIFKFIPPKNGGDENRFVFEHRVRGEYRPYLTLRRFAQWAEQHDESFPPKLKKFWRKCISRITKSPSRDFPRFLMKAGEAVASMAPIRSEPRRAYDAWSVASTSDGGDTPAYMNKIAGSESGEKWNSLQEELRQFGKDSGMFKDVGIKKLGSEHFQVQIKIGAQKINIVDVGYGVSQLLPILMRMSGQKMSFFRGRRLLLQQPEVHLHPQAQAALASHFVDFANKGKGLNYLIETHSDYIVDRIRIKIAQGEINPEHVSLAYHENKGDRVQIHNIGFDKGGNLINAPACYREFFTHETNDLLGFKE